MSVTAWIVLACVIAFLTKLVGYLLPRAWFEREGFQKVSASLTIGLLAGLVAVNTVTDGQQVVLDSRVLALAAAAVALYFKAPYLVVVLVGALAAALGCLAGLP